MLVLVPATIVALLIFGFYFWYNSYCTGDCMVGVQNWEKKCVYDGCVSSHCDFFAGPDVQDYRDMGYPYVPPEGTTQEEIDASQDWPACQDPLPHSSRGFSCQLVMYSKSIYKFFLTS